jgi:flagellin
VSAANLGSGPVATGNTLGTITGLDLNSDGTANSSGGTGAITSINIEANGTGGFIFTDQNDQTISSTAVSNLFTVTGSASGISTISLSTSASNGLQTSAETTAINDQFAAGGSAAAAGTVLGTYSGLDLNASNGSAAAAGTDNTITSITVESNGQGGLQYVDQNGNQLSTAAASNLFSSGATGITTFNASQTTIGSSAATQPAGSVLATVNTDNVPTSVADINVSTTNGANLAIETITNALNTISNIQATLGAAQNRLTGISTSQQDESTDLSSAQSQILDANFAQETANLSKAQVLQQAGISVLAQANSQPQQVLKLLQ